MGEMNFTLPPDLSVEAMHQLERISVTSGHDSVPASCQIQLNPSQLTLLRETDDSGNVSVPWQVKNAGRILINTGTLIERKEPYDLLLELARGKVNQLRNQTFDWLFGGLNMPPSLAQQIRDSTLAFCRSVGRQPSEEARKLAENAIVLACEAADQLIGVYTNQVFKIRKQRQPKMDSVLGCRMGTSIPDEDATASLLKTCNGISIPFKMRDIVPDEGDYTWEQSDALVEWATAQDLQVIGGPIVDFRSSQIPEWLWLWEHDRTRIGKLLCEYAADVVERFQEKISTWQITSFSNVPGVLSLKDDEMLWMTLQIAESVKRVAPDSELIIGICQPWGDYIHETEFSYSPFVFVDTILRSGVNVSAIDLEIVMGVAKDGSYCRDLLDFSRLLDFFALLGVPLNVTIAYPAESEQHESDEQGGQSKGYWRAGMDLHTQSDWASEFGALALCKPYVRMVQWAKFSDAHSELYPHCGLFDSEGNSRPAMQRWRRLHEKYLT